MLATPGIKGIRPAAREGLHHVALSCWKVGAGLLRGAIPPGLMLEGMGKPGVASTPG